MSSGSSWSTISCKDEAGSRVPPERMRLLVPESSLLAELWMVICVGWKLLVFTYSEKTRTATPLERLNV